MKTRFGKIFTLIVVMSVMSTEAFAVNDTVNSLLHMLREIQSKIEVAYNTATKLELKDLNKLVGEKGGLVPQFISDGLSAAYDNVQSTWSDISNSVGSTIGDAVAGASSYLSPVVNGVNSTINGFMSGVNSAAGVVNDGIGYAVNTVGSATNSIMQGVSNTVSPMIETARSAVGGAVANVTQAVAPLVSGTMSTLNNGISYVSGAANSAMGYASGAVNSAIGTAMTGANAVLSPVIGTANSAINYTVGAANTAMGYASGAVNSAIGTAMTGANTVLSPVVGTANSAINYTVGAANSAVGYVSDAAGSALGGAVSKMNDVLGPAVGAVGSAVGNASSMFSGATSYVSNAINSTVGSVMSTVDGALSSTINGIVSGVGGAFGSTVNTVVSGAMNGVSSSYIGGLAANLNGANSVISKLASVSGILLGKGGNSHLDYREFAPTVTSDLQRILKHGFEAIPDIRGYAEEQFKVLSSTDVARQAEVLVQINERLNISAMDAFQRAKNIAAITNNAAEEARMMLNFAGSAKDAHHKFVQEVAQDIEAYRRDVSLNQIGAQLLEAHASRLMAMRQHSTPDTDEDGYDYTFDKNGGGYSSGKGGAVPLKYDSSTGYPASWGRVDVVPCGTMRKVHDVAAESVQNIQNGEVVADMMGNIGQIRSGIQQKASDRIDQMKQTIGSETEADVNRTTYVQSAYDDILNESLYALEDVDSAIWLAISDIVGETSTMLDNLAASSNGGVAFFANAAQDIVAAAQAKIDEALNQGIQALNDTSKSVMNEFDHVAREGISVAGNGTNRSSDLPVAVRQELNSMHSAADRQVISKVSDVTKDVKNVAAVAKSTIAKMVDTLKKEMRRAKGGSL